MSTVENNTVKIEWYEEAPEAFEQNRSVPFNHDLGGTGANLTSKIPIHIKNERGLDFEDVESLMQGLQSACCAIRDGEEFDPTDYEDTEIDVDKIADREADIDQAAGFMEKVIENYNLEGMDFNGSPERLDEFIEKFNHLGKASEGFSKVQDFYKEDNGKETYSSVGADILLPPTFECDEFQVSVDNETERLLEDLYLAGNEVWGFSHTLKKNHYDHVVENEEIDGRPNLTVQTETYDSLEYLEDQKPEWADGWLEISYISEDAGVSEEEIDPDQITSAPDKISDGGLGVYLWSDIVEEFGGYHDIEIGENGEYVDRSVIPYSENYVEETYRREDRLSEEKLVQENRAKAEPVVADD